MLVMELVTVVAALATSVIEALAATAKGGVAQNEKAARTPSVLISAVAVRVKAAAALVVVALSGLQYTSHSDR